jgi:hypothetical protein
VKRLIFFVCVLLVAPLARAEHFIIELTIQGTQDEAVAAHADTDPPAQGLKPRPICHAKKGQDLVLQFFLTSNFPHNALKAVKVHYFIAPEKEAANKSPRDADKAAVVEGSFVMDFKPETGRVGLRQRFHIDQAGAYLVRVESEHSDNDHEHFAALDLVIE